MHFCKNANNLHVNCVCKTLLCWFPILHFQMLLYWEIYKLHVKFVNTDVHASWIKQYNRRIVLLVTVKTGFCEQNWKVQQSVTGHRIWCHVKTFSVTGHYRHKWHVYVPFLQMCSRIAIYSLVKTWGNSETLLFYFLKIWWFHIGRQAYKVCIILVL